MKDQLFWRKFLFNNVAKFPVFKCLRVSVKKLFQTFRDFAAKHASWGRSSVSLQVCRTKNGAES